MRKTRGEKAITLIALIITIVVLLILAVVAINAVTGDGIIQHATNARSEYEKAQDNEVGVLSYYKEYLDVQGDLGPWVQEKTKVINSKTEEELEVGDIVNYVATGSDYANGQWAVLGVEYGKVLLVSTTNVATETLTGREDYINDTGIKRLNAIGAAYDDGIGAVANSGRSIDVDDINRITGYNPQNTGEGKIYEEGGVWQYLNKVTYTINSDGKVYSPELASGIAQSKFMRVEDGTELAAGESITVESNFYKYYPVSLSLDSSPAGEVKGISAGSNAYKLLFEGTETDATAYWLGSSFALTDDGYARFGVRCVYSGCVGGHLLWRTVDGAYSFSCGVRAVVSLQADVQFTPDENNENTYNISFPNK